MDNYYSKMTQDEINQCYQRYASIETEDNVNTIEKKDNVNTIEKKGRREDSEVIIDETTIYEIDMDCYECIQKRMKNKKNNL
ncbi:hypothetical protein SAMN02746066_04015 [Anaerosporobacter mobilis DSM 15930]|uniref:Uncharacterized protein n=1 Tax=Anaerosporobacter mobilis DSM 15930 TaxID=1120996 RepID=A0A1M7MUB3_9FIRM|nr:hypothetical protein [Anaerosporobacter mobilis]SHM94707.1 hypothetical protein SAMN02746066_04015 [Anaerosporobacter mobilis DSM 15930]